MWWVPGEDGSYGAGEQEAWSEAPELTEAIAPPPGFGEPLRQADEQAGMMAMMDGRPAASSVPPVQLTSFQAAQPGMIVRRGSGRVEVDSLETAVAAVRRLAERLGGFVGNVTVESGASQIRQASLELKVPADRFDEALSGLQPLGKVEAVEVSAQDVGEEYVDLNARVDNARRLEARLLDMLDTRTGKLEEALAVERELARVREEIERIEGRLRYLRANVSMSTLTLAVHEPVPVLSGPGQNILVHAFERAWRNFVQLLAGLIAALGFVVPSALIAAGIVWGARRVLRPRPAVPA